MHFSIRFLSSQTVSIILTVLITFSALPSHAQDPDPFSYASRLQPSAEAWQMARHGEISPDLFTGAMAWSLPLYTYKDEDFTIPLSLDYRFDGCRPSQPAGTVGYGWTLNCGGVITREVVGLPDDYVRQVVYVDTDGEQHESWEVGFYYAAIDHGFIPATSLGSILASDTYIDIAHCIGQMSPVILDLGNNSLTMLMGSTPLFSHNTIQYHNGIIDGGPYFDPSSDIYHFSLPEMSGDFIIMPDGSVKVFNSTVPEGEIEVSIIFSHVIRYNRIIIRHRGYSYLFGGDVNHLEYTFETSMGGYNDPTQETRFCFTALRLNTVTAPNGRQAAFAHNAPSPCASMTWKGSVKYRVQGMMGQPDNTWPSVSNGISRPLQSVVVDGDTLISFHYDDKAHAEFGYSAFQGLTKNQYRHLSPLGQGPPQPDSTAGYNTANRLASVAVRNLESDLIDSITLTHSYSSSQSGHSPKMFLRTIQGNVGRYTFDYEHASSSDAWPAVNAENLADHWGYWTASGSAYTDNTSNRQLHSLYDLPSSGKEPDTLHTMYGALHCIGYPSGGRTTLEYEPNRVCQRIDMDAFALDEAEGNYRIDPCQTMLAGGVRISRIVNQADPSGSFCDSTVFDYCNSGILMQMPRYFIDALAAYHSMYWKYIERLTAWLIEDDYGDFTLSSFDNSGLSLCGADGHVGYSRVRTLLSDGSFTENSFHDLTDYPDYYLHDDAGFIGTKTSVYKVMCGATETDSERKGFFIVSQSNLQSPVYNERMANIRLADFSSMRGKPVVEKTFASDSTLLRETRHAYHAATAAVARNVYNVFSNFISADRTLVQPRLDSVITTEYLPSGGFLSDTTLYTYNALGQQTVVEKRGFDGSIRRSRLRYEHESDTTAPRANISEAASTRIVPEGDGVQEYITSLRHFEYDTDSARRHLPVLSVDYGKPIPWAVSADTTIGWHSPLAPDDSVVRRLSYNTKHRPTRLSMLGNSYVAFVWDASGRYPLSREDNGPSMVSTYQWKDMVGLTKKTDPTLRGEWYSYDDKWRLSEVRRADSIKVTAYDYHLWCEDSTLGPSYTKQTTWRTSNKNNRDIVYYDGLGYPIQKVRTSTQVQWGHIVTPIRYDALRRDDVQAYLPYEARYSTYNSADSTAQSQYYKLQFGNSEIYPYAEKVYGTSPAGRLLSSRQPGKDYADSAKVVTYDYRTNTAADSILDLQAVVDTSFKLKVGNGYLPAGRLLLTKATDEDGCTSEVFTDASGKTILSRQRSGGQRLDTYRVYDLRDSLVCVLQPEGAANIEMGSSHSLLPPPAKNSADTIPAVDDLLEKYAFLYSWDSRGRLAAKKRPGAKVEEYLYDDRGRVVLNRDGNLRSQGKWLYSEYDGYDALLKKSLISVELGPDTLRRAARGEIDSTVTITRDTVWMWPYFYNQNTDIVLFGRTATLAVGDSLFYKGAEGFDYVGPAEGAGNDPSLGHYVVFEMENYYVGSEISCFPHEYRNVTIDADWPAILANAITDSTLLEEHRYDSGDSPAIPQNLAFQDVTGIVSQNDLGSTRNLEVWQRQLMLPPGRTVPGDTTRYVERAFYYDVPGNMVQTVETNALGGISRTSTKYDYLGNVLDAEENHTRAGSATADVKRTSYGYDNQGRISAEYASLNNTAVTETEFDYDIFGHLTWTWGQGEESEKALQEMYSYDIRGRLLTKEAFRMGPYEPGPGGGGGGDEEEEEEEEDPEWDAVSLFNMALRYNNPLKSASSRKWNGLISEIAHQRGDNGAIITNEYYYDGAGRLVDNQRYDSSSLTDKYTERDLSFDRNGNILTLKRYGTNVAAPQDNLAYTYEGNKLMQLNNATYQYDANGNMTHDGRRGLDLSWNHLNLPATISNDEDEDVTVNYTYLADGTKVLAQAPGTSEGYAYLGTMVYKLNNGSWTLETTPFTGGRFVRNATGAFVEQRHITDHLGSTRTIVEGNDYTEVEQNDYYPFGKRIADNTLPTTATNRWRFSGKEIQTLGGIGLVDFGARLYDDFSGRWKTQDALSESYLGLSPYSYCSGDPIIYTDEEGYWIANVISAAVEYGFQVYNNYQKGLSGLDALINNIDFADVVIAAINPVGKFAAVKSLVTNMAKEAIDFTLSGDFSINADAETLENAAVNTLIDMGVGKVSNAGKTISETAKKEVKKASSNAIRKSNISKYRPRSTKRAKAAEDAQSALQAAREKEVAGEIITKTAPVADPLTKKTIENERDKKKHSKEK